MAIAYSQSGFNFGTSAAEVAGVAHKIISFEKHAVNQPTKDIMKSIKTNLTILDNAIKKAQNAAAAKALSSLLSEIKADYSAIISGVKAFINSPDANKKKSATELAKKVSKVGDIFTGKTNEQLGRILSQIELFKKGGTTDLQTLGLDNLLTRMETSISNYQKNYSAKVEEAINNKSVDMGKAAEAVKKDIQNLRKKLTAFQELGPVEDKLVGYLNNMWKEAKSAQSQSSAAKKKARENRTA